MRVFGLWLCGLNYLVPVCGSLRHVRSFQERKHPAWQSWIIFYKLLHIHGRKEIKYFVHITRQQIADISWKQRNLSTTVLYLHLQDRVEASRAGRDLLFFSQKNVYEIQECDISIMHGVSKRALQWYSKCYCVASVTKTFTLKGAQTIHRSRSWNIFLKYIKSFVQQYTLYRSNIITTWQWTARKLIWNEVRVGCFMIWDQQFNWNKLGFP
jgi:hypothetical protein